MRRILVRGAALPVLFLVASIAARPARAVDEPTALTFRLPDLTVQADGTNPTQGTILALLDLMGDNAVQPPVVASYNVAFELAGQPGGVALGAPQDAAANRLFPAGNTFAAASALPHTIRFAKDATAPIAAVDGAYMVAVPFTVSAGVTSGTFPLQFIPGNELTNPNADSLPIVLVGGSITVMPLQTALAGDYNGNGAVDAADYVLWRNTTGQTGTGLPADGNGNNSIDAGDYNVWRAGFGQTAASGLAAATAVPEPNVVWLGLVAWLVFGSLRRSN